MSVSWLFHNTGYLGLGQLMGVLHKRTCTWDLQTSRKKAADIHVETGTNSCSSWNIFNEYWMAPNTKHS